ncbi:MAG: polyphosphate kinase 2 [Gammaproteobacteria bacterium]|nr:polyphosphate kinase 2 [Gammaproteobacteria bacterium]
MSDDDREFDTGTLSVHVEATAEELESIRSKAELLELLGNKRIDIDKALDELHYEQELERLQTELVQMHRSIQREGRRVAIIFEGRDAAGKSSTIRRFTQHLNPRTARVVALPKPTEVQRGQWFFQRYVEQLPGPGEIVFFDRSWYNRAVVEPVMGFCTNEQYEIFMRQVPEFEHMLFEDDLELIKIWFAISPQTQAERFAARRTNPLKQWKLSTLDGEAQNRWDRYTHYIDEMFRLTHKDYSPWLIVNADRRKPARLETIRHVLHTVDYEGKNATGACHAPDPAIIAPYTPDAEA